MSIYWKRIIQSQYEAGNKTADEIRAYVPKLITQAECDEILGIS